MSINPEIMISTHALLTLIAVMLFLKFKKRKKSAKSIYKLINDLEKKYIY